MLADVFAQAALVLYLVFLGTLVIDRAWTDAAGNPLKETFRKSFTVGPPEDKALDVKTWKLNPPAARGRAPLPSR